MSFLAAITTIASVLWGIVTLTAIATAETVVVGFTLIVEAILVFVTILCWKKCKSPEYKAKQQKAREDYARIKEGNARYKAIKRERDRQRYTPVSTRLLGESAAEYKRSVGSMAVRGAVGSILGPGGAMIGMATTKSKNVNKDMRRFLVKYEDGHIAEEEVRIGSSKYDLYMQLLEWDE